mmetsp:Transcript_50791/g.168234  ORF Transcript_50791/g.168234 Transcript_50791/m.168234 type:complete len:200 (-) Transcript_50791:440-1039(-)
MPHQRTKTKSALGSTRVRRSHVYAAAASSASGSSLSKRENATRVAVTGGESEGRQPPGPTHRLQRVGACSEQQQHAGQVAALACGVEGRGAGVLPSSWPARLADAPPSRRSSADRVCPGWQAMKRALVPSELAMSTAAPAPISISTHSWWPSWLAGRARCRPDRRFRHPRWRRAGAASTRYALAGRQCTAGLNHCGWAG